MQKSQYEPYFKDKKITAMGIGLLGRGTGDIDFMAECGAQICATDLRSKATLSESLKLLSHHKSITYTLDKHLIRDFKNRDLVIHAAGIPAHNKYLSLAQESGALVTMSFAYLVHILEQEKVPVTIIGVTGTKGKSTTTGLIEAILKASGKRYHLAGNVRGIANLPLLKEIEPGDIILAELDSWQLQGMHQIKRSPHIAVFTNFFEDHMNYYAGSMKRYFMDKEAIFSYQKKGDVLILTNNANNAIKTYSKTSIQSNKKFARVRSLPAAWTYRIFGDHNEENLAMAYEVGRSLEIPKRILKKALTEFGGVEGRFQYLGTSEKRELVFFNDNNSTTPGSTITSLKSLKKRFPNKKIILIGGGADKDFHYEALSRYIARNIEFAFFFPGKATDKICELFPKQFKDFTRVLSMRTAFNLALREADNGDIIVLSPGAASFGLFKNEYERNDQFIERVRQYLRNS